MQILVNHGFVGQAVEALIAERIILAEGEVIHVTLTEDGATVHILPEGVSPADEEGNESSGSEQAQTTGENQRRKPRRTKAQIEADNLAEAQRLAEAQASAASGNDVEPTPKPIAEAASAVASDAGETTQEVLEDGEAEVAADPIVDTAVVVEPEVVTEPEVAMVVEEAQVEAEPVAETAPVVAEGEAAVKPKGVSLFQNLRRPNNG